MDVLAVKAYTDKTRITQIGMWEGECLQKAKLHAVSRQTWAEP